MTHIRNFIGLLSLTLMALAWTSAAAATELYQAQYEGDYSGWEIRMVRTLSATEAGGYEFHSEAKNMFASIAETSEFDLVDGHIQAREYRYFRKVFGRKKAERLLFEPNAVIFTRDGKQEFTHENRELAFTDPTLYQLQLQERVMGGAKTVELPFYKRKKTEHYGFIVEGNSAIELRGKRYEAVLAVRKDQDKVTRVWLLPELDFVVGKLEHKDDDDIYTLTLAEYRVNRERLREFYAQLK